MVATVMRDSTLMVKNTLPAADQVQKLDKKDRVMYIYAGKPSIRYQEKYGSQARIQLNDKIATPEDVPSFILRAREEVSEGEIPFMTTSIKADKESSVGTITDIRIKLRDVNSLKLSYSTQTGADN